jgi:hypothetical protein
MSQLRTFFRRIQIPEKFVPFIFLGVLFLAFGLVITSLGIYQDDWVFVYNAYIRGPQGLWDFLYADGTPFAALMNAGLFFILGVKPLYWHLAALIARWLTVVIFWLVLRRLWPDHPLQNFFVSLLFAVYPFFTLQPLAYTYLHAWIAYFFLGLSIYWMILSVQYPDKYGLYLALSLGAGIVSGSTGEYFMGWEFLRPLILWLALRDGGLSTRTRLIKTLRLWLPYLLLFVLYVWWRFFIYQVPIENRNDPVVLKTLLTDPINGISMILSNLLPDVLSIVVATWYKVLDPLFFNLTKRIDLLFILLSILVAAGIYLVFIRFKTGKEEKEARSSWTTEALWLGIMIVVLGLIPPYVGGLFINEKNPLWNSRFGLASMLGAALIIVALVELIAPKNKTRFVIISILIGLAVGYHARSTNDFRYAWKKETNLFRQLKLRIPALQPGTPIVAGEEILYYMGDYPTAYAVNTIFSKPFSDTDPNIDYWFFGMTTNFGDSLDSFLDGRTIDAAHRSITFSGRSDESIIVSFNPDQHECLYVIRPEDAWFRNLNPLLKEASHLSVLDRIDTDADPTSPFLQAIGLQYPEDWCTYYQKADLARQRGEPEKVIALWKEAREKGLSPGAYFEYFLFLDAFSDLKQWEDAAQVSFEAIHRFPVARYAMCDYWNASLATPEREKAFEKLNQKLDCSS